MEAFGKVAVPDSPARLTHIVSDTIGDNLTIFARSTCRPTTHATAMQDGGADPATTLPSVNGTADEWARQAVFNGGLSPSLLVRGRARKSALLPRHRSLLANAPDHSQAWYSLYSPLTLKRDCWIIDRLSFPHRYRVITY